MVLTNFWLLISISFFIILFSLFLTFIITITFFVLYIIPCFFSLFFYFKLFSPALQEPNSIMDTSENHGMKADPTVAAFSIMFVSVGFSCFIWQSIRSGWMFYKIYKPIHGIVFAQAVLGVILTFCTLLTSLVHVNCKFVSIFQFFVFFFD